MPTFRFTKAERLCSKKTIGQIFDRKNTEAKSLMAYPIRLVFMKNTAENGLTQTLFSVPKRSFKKAVDRNLLRRRMREAYRLHKTNLPKNTLFFISFLYVGKEIADFNVIEKQLINGLQKLNATSQKESEV